ncbi:trp operon leader peptide [Streptomyces acidicola]|nr:trp operon leader peptide [Streptomyces acidicola]
MERGPSAVGRSRPVSPNGFLKGPQIAMSTQKRCRGGSATPVDVVYGSGMFALSTQNWWWTAHPAAH